MLDDEKARSITKAQAARLSPEELEDKIVTGVLHHKVDRPEFQRSYASIAARAQAEAAEQAEILQNERGGAFS